jgi:peptidoglycan/xylan/chitin deacetylase (PgdA/CDA1 family)
LSLLAASAWGCAKALGAGVALDKVFGNEPVILMYHRFSAVPTPRCVDAAAFDWQMSYLARECNVVSWAELIAGLRAHVAWPRNTVTITVDDGYADLHEFAFPILKEYSLPALAYVTSGFAAGQLWHWPDRLHYVISASKVPVLRVETASGKVEVQLNDETQRLAGWHRIADCCHALDEHAREDLIGRVARNAQVPIPEKAPQEYRAANWDELREMVAGGISIGAHSVTHPRLPTLDDVRLAAEIERSRQHIEQALQIPVTSFAYPFGEASDHDERVRAAVLRAGFESACVSYFDTQLSDDLFALRRFGVSPDPWDFLKVVDGLKRARAKQREYSRRSHSRVRG